MENTFPANLDMENLVKELVQGREMARQLQINFNNVQSSSHETRQFLLHRIMNSYDHALFILGNDSRNSAVGPPTLAVDSPRSLAGSVHSDDSDQDLKDQASRKRKAMQRWTQRVRVYPEFEIEKQLDDGYGWRKYGQKDILGAKYPRGYYRCTYRNVQGCLATKQVQRSDEDSTIFEVTYRGKHTCTSGENPSDNNNNDNNRNRPVTFIDPQNNDPNPLTKNPYQPQVNEPPPFFNNYQTSPRVITRDLESNTNPSNIGHTLNTQNNQIILDCDNLLENNNFINSISELNRIVTGTTSASDTPTIGPDFPFIGPNEFGSNFSFGGYFP